MARSSRLVRNTVAGCRKLRSQPTARKPPLLASSLATQSHPQLQSTLIRCDHLQRPFRTRGTRVPRLHPSSKSPKAHQTVLAHSHNRRPRYTLPFYKADRYFLGNTVLITTRNDNIDPVERLQSYLDDRDRLFLLRPELFSRRMVPYRLDLGISPNWRKPSRRKVSQDTRFAQVELRNSF